MPCIGEHSRRIITLKNPFPNHRPSIQPVPCLPPCCAGYGMSTDRVTTYINAAMCDTSYRAKNRPIVIDLPIREPDSTLS